MSVRTLKNKNRLEVPSMSIFSFRFSRQYTVGTTLPATVDTTLQATENRPNGQRRENNLDPGGLGRKFAAGQWKRQPDQKPLLAVVTATTGQSAGIAKNLAMCEPSVGHPPRGGGAAEGALPAAESSQ
ncbi:hypothetical protein V2G26_001025 [Clonostachys chloroleuca]